VPICPKNHKTPTKAYQVYVQTRNSTGHSTTVPLPYALCATPATKVVDGREIGTYKVDSGQHGLVALNEAKFAAHRRQQIAATGRTHPKWRAKDARKRPAKTRPKAESSPSATGGASPSAAAGGA
jgi:hypothetical protein